MSKIPGSEQRRRKRAKATVSIGGSSSDPRVAPDWSKTCEVCGGTPILPSTGLCGPCTFGDASTANGNW